MIPDELYTNPTDSAIESGIRRIFYRFVAVVTAVLLTVLILMI